MKKINYKITFLYIFILAGIVLGVALVLRNTTSPRLHLLGKWKEISWTYEKVNRHKETKELIDKEITDEVKHELGENLFIHRAEIWEFLKDGSLILHKSDGTQQRIHWKLKGYGRVLKLHYPNEKDEYYDVDAISEDAMTIYFDVEIQAKGIVRMQFKKIS